MIRTSLPAQVDCGHFLCMRSNNSVMCGENLRVFSVTAPQSVPTQLLSHESGNSIKWHPLLPLCFTCADGLRRTAFFLFIIFQTLPPPLVWVT